MDVSDVDLKAVDLFLKTVTREIKKGNCYFVINRKVHYNNRVISAREALAELGILRTSQIWEYVLNLNVKDCFRISKDYDFKRDYNDDMYEFVTYINGIKTYIKLTLNSKNVVCLSFHKSDR